MEVMCKKLCLGQHSATLPDCHTVKGNKELVVFAQKNREGMPSPTPVTITFYAF